MPPDSAPPPQSAASSAPASGVPSAAVKTPSAPPLLPADTTGLYALGGLSALAFAVTTVLYFFYGSSNPFVQHTLLPHFHRFGWWSETLLLAIGLYAGWGHVARLRLRHHLLRIAFVGLFAANLWAQWELHRLWLSF